LISIVFLFVNLEFHFATHNWFYLETLGLDCRLVNSKRFNFLGNS
jgi:hypothetical protein